MQPSDDEQLLLLLQRLPHMLALPLRTLRQRRLSVPDVDNEHQFATMQSLAMLRMLHGCTWQILGISKAMFELVTLHLEGRGEPFVEGVCRVEHLRQQEVEQRPQLAQRVLYKLNSAASTLAVRRDTTWQKSMGTGYN